MVGRRKRVPKQYQQVHQLAFSPLFFQAAMAARNMGVLTAVHDARSDGLAPAEVAAAIDEIPILALAATAATGTTRIRGGGELRHKESDRIAGIAAGLTALGADIRVEGDDIEIHGGRPLSGAVTETHDDHRLAMTFAIAWSGGSGTRYQTLTAIRIATSSQYQSGGTMRPTRWTFRGSAALSLAM